MKTGNQKRKYACNRYEDIPEQMNKVLDKFGYDENVQNLVYWVNKLQKERAAFRKKAVKYDKLIQSSTLEEVKKEWEENKWKVSEDEYFETITFIKGENGIEFNIKDEKYFTFQKDLEHNSFDIDCKLHELITKTLKAIKKEKKDE